MIIMWNVQVRIPGRHGGGKAKQGDGERQDEVQQDSGLHINISTNISFKKIEVFYQYFFD